MGIFNEKCRYWKVCNQFESDSAPCVRDGGDYYGPGRQGGCFRGFIDIENKNMALAKIKKKKGRFDNILFLLITLSPIFIAIVSDINVAWLVMLSLLISGCLTGYLFE